MTWLAKLENLFATVSERAGTNWETAFVLSSVIGVVMVIFAMKDPSKLDLFKSKARIFRYCHDCPFVDMTTETCSILASQGEKCGLIDRTAGMTFEVKKIS